MEINSLKLNLFKMTILKFKDFMKKYNLKNDTMNESQLQKIYNIYTPEIVEFIQREDIVI